jgi:hypothetical protein
MNLRSGKISRYTPICSKGFNVKGRATAPLATNVLITNDARKRALAENYGVRTIDLAVTLLNAHDCERDLDKQFSAKYLLIGYGADWLYYGVSPLPLRGARPTTKAPKADPKFPLALGTDVIEIEVWYNSPALLGSEAPTRDVVMGDSALNYAASVYGDEWARARNWEWLHIVAHSLGGNNEVGNLVAGTYDANTKMIPFEKEIRDLSQDAAKRPLLVSYKIDLFPDSWVAIGIGMNWSAITSNGFLFKSADFQAQSDLCFDKLQYDIWASAIGS